MRSDSSPVYNGDMKTGLMQHSEPSQHGANSESQLQEAKRAVYSLLFKLVGKRFYSQAGQDVFVASVLSEKIGGFYVEVGGGDPSDSNNTILLEKDYKWKGISLEANESLAALWANKRSNEMVEADALDFDFLARLRELRAPNQIDYLSLDIAPAENTFEALRRLPHESYRFSVITFEHDRYRSGSHYMAKSRSLLRSMGYQLVVANLKNFGRDFEDWWVDPRVVRVSDWKPWESKKVEFSSLLSIRPPLITPPEHSPELTGAPST